MTNTNQPVAKGPERSIRSLVSSVACCLLLTAAASCGGELTLPEDPTRGASDESPLHAATAATAWQVTGVGVNYRGTGSAGSNVFIGYAGYGYSDAQAQAWLDALYTSTLSRLGVGHLYAVRGPADVGYARREIGNTKLIAHLLPRIDAGTKLIVVAAHSSGSYVANELFGFLHAGGKDPTGKTADKTVYFNLDGGNGLTATDVSRLYRTFFVFARDGRTGTRSPNASAMINQATTFAPRASSLQLAGDGAGCASGGAWCLHMALITTRPHSTTGMDARDYTDFAGRPVQSAYLDQNWTLLDGMTRRP